ncbi:MAG: hypothetical protein WA902_01225, partial [Thermosynechococcaceae cyanobacterium]
MVCEVAQSKSSKLKSVPFWLGTTLVVASILSIADPEQAQAYISQGSKGDTAPKTPQIFERKALSPESLLT